MRNDTDGRALRALGIGAVALFSATVFTPPTAATAAEGAVTWSIQPASANGADGRSAFEYQAPPGSVISDFVGVTNNANTALTFRIYAADATTDYDSAAFTLIGSDQASTGAGAWTSIDGARSTCDDSTAGNNSAEAGCAAKLGTSVTIEAGKSAVVPFTVTVPRNAEPGDHAAGIVASYTASGGKGTSVQREMRVGTRVYLRVDGALSPDMALTGVVAGFDAGSNWFNGTARIGFEIANRGNTRISAQPIATLTGPLGIPLGSVRLEPVRNIVPGESGRVSARLDGIPALVLLYADIRVEPLAADGIAEGDPLPGVATGSSIAWAVPWVVLGLVALLAASIAMLLWRRKRGRQLLAEDLAAYTEQIRAEERALARGESGTP